MLPLSTLIAIAMVIYLVGMIIIYANFKARIDLYHRRIDAYMARYWAVAWTLIVVAGTFLLHVGPGSIGAAILTAMGLQPAGY